MHHWEKALQSFHLSYLPSLLTYRWPKQKTKPTNKKIILLLLWEVTKILFRFVHQKTCWLNGDRYISSCSSTRERGTPVQLSKSEVAMLAVRKIIVWLINRTNLLRKSQREKIWNPTLPFWQLLSFCNCTLKEKPTSFEIRYLLSQLTPVCWIAEWKISLWLFNYLGYNMLFYLTICLLCG